MKVGGKVLCIRSFIKSLSVEIPSPKEGSVYEVSDLSDDCGCGSRIRLKEFPLGSSGSMLQNTGMFCGFCKTHFTLIRGGWNKTYFIDLEGDQSLDVDAELLELVKLNFERLGEVLAKERNDRARIR